MYATKLKLFMLVLHKLYLWLFTAPKYDLDVQVSGIK